MTDFINPFMLLRGPELENPQGEAVEGSFACQERGCYSTVTDARYIPEVQVLTWVCEDGHMNKVEGFKLDG